MAKYIATAAGYYGQYRNEGDVFDGPSGLKGSWFEPVIEKKAAKQAAPEPPAAAPADSKE
jgi:hypothetical protein